MPAKKRAGISFSLDDALTGYVLSMEARNLAAESTLLSRQVVGYLSDYLAGQNHPLTMGGIERDHLQGYMRHTLERVSPTTADIRFRTLRAFFNWAAREGWVKVSPMAGMQRPKVPSRPKPHFSNAELSALLETCKGSEFDQVRDTAILRFFMGTGCRLEEISGLAIADVDIRNRRATVTGKGSQTRMVRIGPRTAAALHKYLLLRPQHPDAPSGRLWLGTRGPLTSGGISQVVRRRATEAGLEHANPHKFRHTFAHMWRKKGGSVVDLEILMGWSPNSPMSRHYGASAMAEVALEHADAYSVGEDV